MRSALRKELEYPEFQRINGKLLFAEKYEVIKKVGSGSYGNVYKLENV